MNSQQAALIATETTQLLCAAEDIVHGISGSDLAKMPEHCAKKIIRLKKHTENLSAAIGEPPPSAQSPSTQPDPSTEAKS